MDYKTIFSKDAHLETGKGRMIQIDLVNKVLFGTKIKFPFIGKIPLLNANIISSVNDKFYIYTSKLDEYIELVNNSNTNYFPYNYCELFGYQNREHYKEVFQPIKEYLNYLDKLDNQFSRGIKSILFRKNLLNAELVSELNGLYCIKFDKIGKPLFIFLSDDNSKSEFYLSYKNNNEEQYQRLFEKHKTVLLMEDPETFLVNNLERVTGNLEFSQLLVKSYLHKDKFETPILGLIGLVLWKNNNSIFNYVEKFKNKYPHLVNDENTNFEGINKFILNLEENDLQQWEMKEQINELYYNITHELIKSYEILYLSK